MTRISRINFLPIRAIRNPWLNPPWHPPQDSKTMKPIIHLLTVCLLFACAVPAQESLEPFRRELEGLKRRVTALEEENGKLKKQLEVDRLIVKKELIVSDTGLAWEKGFETQQIPRGIYAKSLAQGTAGLWIRSRLIKGEIDDPFDDR